MLSGLEADWKRIAMNSIKIYGETDARDCFS